MIAAVIHPQVGTPTWRRSEPHPAGLEPNLPTSPCLQIKMYHIIHGPLDGYVLCNEQNVESPTEESRVYEPSDAPSLPTLSSTASYRDNDTIYAQSVYEPPINYNNDPERRIQATDCQLAVLPMDQDYVLRGMGGLNCELGQHSSLSSYKYVHGDWCRNTGEFSQSESSWSAFGDNDGLVQSVNLQEDDPTGYDKRPCGTTGSEDSKALLGFDYSFSTMSMDLDPYAIQTRCDSADPLEGHRLSYRGLSVANRTMFDVDQSRKPRYIDRESEYLSSVDDFEVLFSGDTTVSDSEFSAGTTYEPGMSAPRSLGSKITCLYPGCVSEFTYMADRKRHVNTVHKAGQSYRCAFNGCAKADKVWTRLDSFKKHTRLHRPADMEALVQQSRTERHHLPMSMTTLITRPQPRSSGPGSGPLRSHTCSWVSS